MNTPAPKFHYPANFSADVEQDCPPFMDTTRGMAEGLPRLLNLLDELNVKGTFFTTGEMARRFPAVIERLVAEGHELGCHGDQHRDFTTLDRTTADNELADSLRTLRGFAPVVSFRAPYLRFPSAYLPLLVEHGIRIDSSLARYKFGSHHRLTVAPAPLTRMPVCATSSVLRLPRFIRQPWLRRLSRPLLVFVHPWEAVDFRQSKLRLDCRFRTGAPALSAWRSSLQQLTDDGAVWQRLDQCSHCSP
jgi:peptidoglycan/xylan/chitin deacetylase (PgdA/CDA1 family)